MERYKSTYGQNDSGLGRKFRRNINVHLEVGRVGSKVIDTSKGGIGSCAESNNAAEYRGGEVHLDCRASS